MKLLNMDYVAAELMKDLQNSCVFKCKKEKNCLNSYGRDSHKQFQPGCNQANVSEKSRVVKIEQTIVVNEQ